MFLADCTRGKKVKIFIVFILIYLFEKNISFVEYRIFILCKHLLHYSETCQHISLIIGSNRKNPSIFGLKSVEIYIAVMGEINLSLIMLWYLSLISGKNIWHVNITYMYVAFTLF